MNQRHLKFRAWDEGQQYMAYQGTPDLETLQSFIFHFGEDLLMQFTGLKDKSGKEIFEKDIVTCYDHPTGVDNTTGQVYWGDGKWMVTGSMIPLGDFGTAWTEVIGNPYENTSLLHNNK